MSGAAPGRAERTCKMRRCRKKVVARGLCSAHYQAARKAGDLEQHPKAPPPKRDWKVCPADHKHAESSTCYKQHQCRCDPCRLEHNAWEVKRERLKAYGRFDHGLVDAEPVREHLHRLAEFGIGYKRAATLAGVGNTAVRNLIWGRQDPGRRHGSPMKRVKRETAEEILAVKPDLSLLADGARIPARGTHRRLQALVAIGWSQSKLGARLGITPANFSSMMQREHVRVSLHRKVAELFDELWATEPPQERAADRASYTRALGFAKARRWVPPLAWDDIDNDPEPPVAEDDGGIDEAAVELALLGDSVRLTPLERRECVRRLHGRRWSDSRIAETLRIVPRTVLRIREELELDAWDQNDLRDRGAA